MLEADEAVVDVPEKLLGRNRVLELRIHMVRRIPGHLERRIGLSARRAWARAGGLRLSATPGDERTYENNDGAHRETPEQRTSAGHLLHSSRCRYPGAGTDPRR